MKWIWGKIDFELLNGWIFRWGYLQMTKLKTDNAMNGTQKVKSGEESVVFAGTTFSNH